MTVEIVFETHSTTEDSENGVATGWLPGRLSNTGRQNAAALGERRRDDGFAAVFVSDLLRAVETVDIAFAGSAVPVLKDWRLRECDYGLMNGAPSAEVYGDRSAHLEVPYPEGESWRQATDRAGGLLMDLPTHWDGGRILIVGHVATRWALERFLGGRDLHELASAEFVWQEGWHYTLT